MSKAVIRILFLAGFCFQATAQNYPTRPVRILVGFPPAGGMDTIARIIAPRLADALGQPFFVDNRTGAGGAIAADALVRSGADGYTLLLAESGTLIVPVLNTRVTYDPVKQFAPVAGVCSLPLALVVSPGFSPASVRELISTLKANPGKYSYASPGVGTLQHLAFELFQRTAGVAAVHVPYKGASAMLPDLMADQVQIGVISSTVALAQARAGKIRVLAVTSLERMPGAPEVPALAETLAGFSAAPNVFLVAPVGTPSGVTQRISGELRKALALADVQESLAKQGAAPMPLAPERLGAQIETETRRWTAVVKDAGVKLD